MKSLLLLLLCAGCTTEMTQTIVTLPCFIVGPTWYYMRDAEVDTNNIARQPRQLP